MALITPQEINAVQFAVTRVKAGYDQEEVDKFLDSVGATVAQLQHAVADAEARAQAALAKVPSEPVTQVLPDAVEAGKGIAVADARPSVQSVELLLKTAQETADRLIADARAEAAALKTAADGAANEAKVAAQAEITKLKAEAAAEAAKVKAEADQLAHEALTKVEGLKQVHADVLAKLKAGIEHLGELL